MKRLLAVAACVVLAGLLAGCGARETGKFSNKDKPKPVADK
jgi:hypothetical protein